MTKPGIEELLIDCVLDRELLRRLKESPESVFAEYGLSDQEREILVSADDRLLGLLGKSVLEQADDVTSIDVVVPPPGSPSISDEPAVLPMTESRLALRLVPYLHESTINYAAHVDPLPAGTELDELPEAPSAAAPGQQLPPLGLAVAVQPHVSLDAAGNQRITFSVSAHLPQDPAVTVAAGSTGSPNVQRLSPWQHDVDSPEVKEAAGRVRDADGSDRHDRLLQLIEVVVAPMHRAETGR